MIIDDLKNLEKYFSGPLWETAFGFLRSAKPDIEPGEYILQNSDLFAVVSETKTKSLADAVFEGHKKYIDIHTLLSGSEIIEWNPARGLNIAVPYNSEKDFLLFEKPEKVYGHLLMEPGLFALFFPEDAHAPLLAVNEKSGTVKKIVVKIAVNSIIK